VEDDIKDYIVSGSIKELIRRIEYNLERPSQDSVERITKMAQSIINIMKKNYSEILKDTK